MRASRASKNQEQHDLPGRWKVFIVLVLFNGVSLAEGDLFQNAAISRLINREMSGKRNTSVESSYFSQQGT